MVKQLKCYENVMNEIRADVIENETRIDENDESSVKNIEEDQDDQDEYVQNVERNDQDEITENDEDNDHSRVQTNLEEDDQNDLNEEIKEENVNDKLFENNELNRGVKDVENVEKNDDENHEDNDHDHNEGNEVNGISDEHEDDKDKFAAKCYDFGFLHSKIIKNIFCCLNETQQIGMNLFILLLSMSDSGLYFLICVFLELSLLSSDVSIYILLYNTDFSSFAILLLLLKVKLRT